MTAFRKKKISLETLPEYLRETRELFSLTVSQVCRLTQIPPKHLEALEQGNYETLPADVYVRGYLKSLALVYKVSEEALLSQFAKERGIDFTVKLGDAPKRSSEELSKPRFALTPRSLTIFAVAVLAVGSVGYLVWQLRSVSAAPELSVIYPEADTTVSTRSILLRGETEIGARVYINGQEVLVDEFGDFREVVNLTEGSNRLNIVSRNKFGNETSKERVLVVSGVEKIASVTANTTISEEFPDKPIVVGITVGQDSAWINILADGQSVHNGTVDAGTKLTFSAENELLLTTGNAGVTNVTYNRQELGALGKIGEVISDIRFTP